MNYYNYYKLIILLIFINNITCIKKGATSIDNLRREFLNIANETLVIANNYNLVDLDVRLREVNKIYTNFITNNLTANNYASANDFYYLEHLYEWKLLEKDLITVNNLFDTFKMHLLHIDNHNMDELAGIDFAETVLNDKKWPIPDTLEQIENIMIKQNLYYRILLETTEHVCDTQQSAQQVIYQLYNAISITEIKAYSMMQFSWMILKMYGRGNFTKELELMRQRFNERIESTQVILKSVLERSDRFVYRCDPTVHKEGETYVQLTKLLQGYVENEVDMNNDDTCKETCSHYQYTESFGCYKDLFCAKQSRCRGKLLNCEFVKSDMHICQSSPSSSRRYEYIEYSSGRVLGQKSTCSRGTTPVDSWWRWIFWHCSYCFCICDDSMNSDRYFNLRPIMSNTSDNRVVTGLRFRKHNRVIHLQIQEGQLGGRGNINATTLSWKSLENYRITDRGIKNGVDYHTMTWNNRSIDLDDLFAKPGHVVTGVRFRIVGTHVNLEMRITEFDFVSGLLLEPETTSEWISNDNTDASSLRRTPIQLYKPDVPIKKRYSKIDSKSNQYISFNHSDMDADAAQTTVPFLDAQDVISVPPVPLGGIGLYHKGNSNYGGFVAPKIITYNYASHIMNPSDSDELSNSENNIL